MLAKLLKWLPANLAGIIGVAQAIVKLVKEVLTLIVDILYPVIPSAKFKQVVDTIRNMVNTVDNWLEKLKGFFLGNVV